MGRYDPAGFGALRLVSKCWRILSNRVAVLTHPVLPNKKGHPVGVAFLVW